MIGGTQQPSLSIRSHHHGTVRRSHGSGKFRGTGSVDYCERRIRRESEDSPLFTFVILQDRGVSIENRSDHRMIGQGGLQEKTSP